MQNLVKKMGAWLRLNLVLGETQLFHLVSKLQQRGKG